MYGKTVQNIPIWLYMYGFTRFLFLFKDSILLQIIKGRLYFLKAFCTYMNINFSCFAAPLALTDNLTPASITPKPPPGIAFPCYFYIRLHLSLLQNRIFAAGTGLGKLNKQFFTMVSTSTRRGCFAAGLTKAFIHTIPGRNYEFCIYLRKSSIAFKFGST